MTKIHLETTIKGNIQEVFDLSRSIDFHVQSASFTKEKAIAGVTTGLINLNQIVQWRGKHLGFWLTHTSKIIEFEAPTAFTDVMIQGNFTYFIHKHKFVKTNNGVLMTDILQYKIPYGILGKIVDKLILKAHLTRFLERRNRALKEHIEQGRIKSYASSLEAETSLHGHLFI